MFVLGDNSSLAPVWPVLGWLGFLNNAVITFGNYNVSDKFTVSLVSTVPYICGQNCLYSFIHRLHKQLVSKHTIKLCTQQVPVVLFIHHQLVLSYYKSITPPQSIPSDKFHMTSINRFNWSHFFWLWCLLCTRNFTAWYHWCHSAFIPRHPISFT